MIILIGLGAGDLDTLTRGAERELREASVRHRSGAGKLFVRTERHPVIANIADWNLAYESFDAIYESQPNFAEVYAAIVDRVLAAARRDGGAFPVAFAVPGHPLFGEETVRLIRERAIAENIPTRVVSSGSFVEAALTAAGADLGDGCDVRDALTLTVADTVDRAGMRSSSRLDPSRGLLVFQIFDRDSASHAKICLMRDYPDDWTVKLIRQAGVSDRQSVTAIPLYRLDREPVDHLSTLYVPPLPAEMRRPTFASLAGIMSRLRAPDGCPWDREQTPKSLKRFFIEETYEAIEAIDADDPDLLCEELGDVLLQVVFHAQIAAEEGVFTIDDVTAGIVHKLVRRHPHVFGEVRVEDSAEVLRNWEQIKREEKTANDANWRKSILDGIPKGLPALMHAWEISKKVAKVGFEWPSFPDVLAKVDEELAELKAEFAAAQPDRERIASEIGDLLFTVVQVARWQRIDPEEALRSMLARFSKRFGYIEQWAQRHDKPLAEMRQSEMEQLWNEAKSTLTDKSLT